jgi:hypothetical protein
MSHRRHAWHCRTAAGELPADLYIAPAPWPRRGRPVKHHFETWRVIDDWPSAFLSHKPRSTSLKPGSATCSTNFSAHFDPQKFVARHHPME